MNVLRFVDKILLAIERSLVVLLLSTMVLLSFLQVVLRNYFSTGILWADPFLRHLVLWVGFLGASLATQREKHINIDLITRFVGPKPTNVIRIVTYLFAAIVCFLLARAGLTFLNNEMQTGSSLFDIGNAEIPTWWFELIIPIGFSLIMFRFILRAIERIAAPPSAEGRPPEEISA